MLASRHTNRKNREGDTHKRQTDSQAGSGRELGKQTETDGETK